MRCFPFKEFGTQLREVFTVCHAVEAAGCRGSSTGGSQTGMRVGREGLSVLGPSRHTARQSCELPAAAALHLAPEGALGLMMCAVIYSLALGESWWIYRRLL